MNRLIKTAIAATLGVSFLTSSFAAEKPKYTIEEIMKAINKGKESIGNRIKDGSASKEDIKKMVEYYSSLPLNDPPKGDAKLWKEKATALVAAAKDLEKGSEGAHDKFMAAVDCKACHKEFKPEKKKE